MRTAGTKRMVAVAAILILMLFGSLPVQALAAPPSAVPPQGQPIATPGKQQSQPPGLYTPALWGGSQDEIVTGSTIDSNGNVYVVGATSSYSQVSECGNNPCAFVTKFSPSGIVQWSRVWGGGGGEFATGVVVAPGSPASAIYVTGDTQSYRTGSATTAYVPVIITNNQGSSTPSPFQQMITFVPSAFKPYEKTDLGNIRFCADAWCNSPLYAWLESCVPSCNNNAASAVVWVRLPNSIGGNGGTETIYMILAPTATPFDGNYWGEAPQLSGTYGQYDNGANVFGLYQNWAGSTLPSGWAPIGNGGTYSVSNGLKLTSSIAKGWIHVYATNLYAPSIVEAQTKSAFDNSVTAVGFDYANPSAGGDWGWSYGYHAGYAASSSNYYFIIGDSGGSPTSSQTVPGTAPHSGTIMSLAWPSPSTESLYLNYVSEVSGTDNAVAYPLSTYFVVGHYGYSSGQSISLQWTRSRASPPGGVMPSVSVGSLIAHSHIFLMKLSTADGSSLWGSVQTWGGGEDDYANAVTTGPDGSVYIAGTSNSTDIWYDSASPSFHLPQPAAVLLKYTASGSFIWARSLSAPARSPFFGCGLSPCGTFGNAVVVSSTGDVYLGGATISEDSPFPQPMIAKLTDQGQSVWIRPFYGDLPFQGATINNLALSTDGGTIYFGGSYDNLQVKNSIWWILLLFLDPCNIFGGNPGWDVIGLICTQILTYFHLEPTIPFQIITYTYAFAGDMDTADPPTFTWSQSWGVSNTGNTVSALFVTSDGLYVAGITDAESAQGINRCGGIIVGGCALDSFLLKFSLSGTLVTQEIWGFQGIQDIPPSLVLSNDGGSVVLTGSVNAANSFDLQSITGDRNDCSGSPPVCFAPIRPPDGSLTMNTPCESDPNIPVQCTSTASTSTLPVKTPPGTTYSPYYSGGFDAFFSRLPIPGSSSVLQPVQLTSSPPNGVPPQIFTLGGGCSSSPSSIPGDGFPHNVVEAHSCAIVVSAPSTAYTRSVFSGPTGATSTWTLLYCDNTFCSVQPNTYYYQLKDTYQAVPTSPSTWDAKYKIPLTGTYLGGTSSTTCSITTAAGGGTASQQCWFDLNSLVLFPGAVIGTSWTAQSTDEFFLQKPNVANPVNYAKEYVSQFSANANNNWVVMATDGSYIYTASASGLLQKIDSFTGTVTATYQLINGAGIDTMYSDGQYLYVGTTAPASAMAVYKLSLSLQPLYQYTDTNHEGIAKILVPVPGGNVYFDDGGGYLWEFDPTLSTLLGSNAIYPGHSSTDVIYDGTNLWWLDHYGNVVVTGLSMNTIAKGTLPGGFNYVRGLLVVSGNVFCGDGNGGFWSLGISGASVSFTTVVNLPSSAAQLDLSPVYHFEGLVYIPVGSTPGQVLVYTFPGWTFVRTITMPDGEALGMGSASAASTQLLVGVGRVMVMTASHIYDLTATITSSVNLVQSHVINAPNSCISILSCSGTYPKPVTQGDLLVAFTWIHTYGDYGFTTFSISDSLGSAWTIYTGKGSLGHCPQMPDNSYVCAAVAYASAKSTGADMYTWAVSTNAAAYNWYANAEEWSNFGPYTDVHTTGECDKSAICSAPALASTQFGIGPYLAFAGYTSFNSPINTGPGFSTDFTSTDRSNLGLDEYWTSAPSPTTFPTTGSSSGWSGVGLVIMGPSGIVEGYHRTVDFSLSASGNTSCLCTLNMLNGIQHSFNLQEQFTPRTDANGNTATHYLSSITIAVAQVTSGHNSNNQLPMKSGAVHGGRREHN